MRSRVSPPRPGDPIPLRMPAVHRHTLANGLRLLMVEQRFLPIVDVHLVVRTGAVADPRPIAGSTSLAVDLLDEGAAGRSSLEIAQAVEQIGASLYASTGWDSTGVSIHTHSARIDSALRILADVVVRPDMPAADFRRIRDQRLNQLLQERDEPRILASNAFNAIVFGGDHPYGLPLNGTLASVERIAREDAVAYHDLFVRPGNAFLVVVGDVDAATFPQQAETAFDGWTGGPPPEPPPLAVPAPRDTSVFIVDRPGSPQSELRIGAPGVPRSSPDYFQLLVMNTVLGGSFTSRLNLNLRQEKGYTYGAGSSFSFRREAGPFQVSTAVGTAATADAVRQVLLEMERMRVEPVPGPELERAKNYLALGLPRTFETTADIASHVAELELYGLGDEWFSEYVRRVREVTSEEVQRVATSYVDPARSVIVVAGDRSAVEGPLDALGVGPVADRVEE